MALNIMGKYCRVSESRKRADFLRPLKSIIVSGFCVREDVAAAVTRKRERLSLS